eukprot:14014308-Alexandrium_andersonii.AAC.1
MEKPPQSSGRLWRADRARERGPEGLRMLQKPWRGVEGRRVLRRARDFAGILRAALECSIQIWGELGSELRELRGLNPQ